MSAMQSQPTTVQRLFSTLKSQSPAALPSCNGFKLESFSVTYPNGELIGEVDVVAVPDGVALYGVTIAVSPQSDPRTTYCMAVTDDDDGLSLPVSLLAATTAIGLDQPTAMVATLVLSYGTSPSAQKECVTTQTFTVGG